MALFLSIILLLVLATAGVPAAGVFDLTPPGAWQGTSYPALTPHSALRIPLSSTAGPAAQSQWLLLDSGGSGGGFGQGDVRQKLHDVQFWDQRLGWACGYGGVFKTVDGGLTWTRMKPAGGWYQIELTGPAEIWLMEGKHPGGPGHAWLWHSTDGGAAWEEVLPGKLAGYQDLYCHGQECWVMCGGYPAFHSHDGGRTWEQINFGGLLQSAFRIAIPADLPTPGGFTVYVAGNFGKARRLIRSDDGGSTWRLLPLPEAEAYFRYVPFFATSHLGWLGGPGGTVLRTDDGGESWTSCPLPTTQEVMSLWFDQNGRGFAAVNNTDFTHAREALYETADGGRHWTPVLGGQKHVDRIFGLGPGLVWIVGDVPGYIQNDLVGILVGPGRE